MKTESKTKTLLGILTFIIYLYSESCIEPAVLNGSNEAWGAENPLQLLVAGLKDSLATVSAIDVTGDATGEVSIRLKDEEGNIITSEPLGIASDLDSNIWVSFSDKKIRLYNSCGELQKIDGVNWFWTVSNIPDGLDWDGSNLQYCSSGNNKIYRINPSGEDTNLGVVSRRLSLDGVVPDPGTLYTTQEYTGYNPKGISATYLCSSSKVDKRDTSIGANFIQTLPDSSPIWTNEQDTPSPSTGIVEVPDTSVPEGHVVYLSSIDGNIYKLRFMDKKSIDFTPTTLGIQRNVPKSETEPEPLYSGSVAICGREQSVSDSYITTITWRQYFRVMPPPTFIEAFVVLNESFAKWQDRWNGFQWVREFNSYPLASAIFNICSFNENWTLEQKFNNPILSTQLFTYPYDGLGINPNSEVGSKIRVIDVTNITPTTTFYYTGRYGNEGQAFGIGPAPIPDPIPMGYIKGAANESAPYNNRWQYLTDNGSLEVLDQFTPSIPVPQGLAMGKLQIKVDVDVDSDNNNGVNLPEENDTEENIEETQPGKFVTVNHNDDNENGVPDYSDESVSGEGNLVPLIIDGTTLSDWSNVKIVFSYPGEVTLPSFIPQDMENEFKDYTNAKKGTIRIWNISSPQEERTSDKYIQPNREYSADNLGFSGRKVFYLEGINPQDNIKIEVTYKTQDQIAKDSVNVTVVEPNLGVNNSNNSTTLRPGIPDVNFDIDDDDEKSDEMVEDQKDGFNLWWSRDWLTITMGGIVDVAPLLIDVPKSLQDAGFNFYLKVNNGNLAVYPGVSPGDNRRKYLQDINIATDQITKNGILLTPGTVQRVVTQAGKNEFVFNGNGLGKVSVIVSFLIEEPTTSNRVVADSVKITFRDINDHWLFVSARGTPNVPFTYPTEDNRRVDIQRYPDPDEIGGTRDSAKKKHLIMVHGYNVTEDQAKDGYNELYRRLYWLGFRGNFIGFTWDSNEGFPSVVLFDTQVQNAFQTSPSFQKFLQNNVLATWGISPSDVDIMAHSLGNLMVFDTLRLHKRLGTGELTRNVISLESATWPEAYQPEEKNVYERLPNSDAITYTLDQLKRHSWAFWFRQEGYESQGAINGKIYHSYLPDDPALAAMQFNDYKERGTSIEEVGQHERSREWHYWRDRLIRGGNYRAPEGSNNFYNVIPTLMLPANRHVPYGRTDLNLPVGTQPNPMAEENNNYLASDGGWKPAGSPIDFDAHSRYLSERFPNIYKWYDEFLGDIGGTRRPGRVPIGEE
ncbi:MAG: alpha/beta hydrolase [Nitrospinae bacterium]|nr:alpha/beta hydrolase [Nitrospinota bacterium]